MRTATTPHVNTRVADRDFKYYIFDWDDNILHMPTRIHLERRQPDGAWAPHLVSTSVFSLIRGDMQNYRPPNGNWPEAFVEFQDYANESESHFLRDAREAITRLITGSEKPGPVSRHSAPRSSKGACLPSSPPAGMPQRRCARGCGCSWTSCSPRRSARR